MFKEKKEKYYFCENCAKIATETEILKDDVDRLAYGSKICNCEYRYLRWDENIKDWVIIEGKTFIQMVEIPKRIYDALHLEKNDIIRMRMYNSWKKQVLHVDEVRKK